MALSCPSRDSSDHSETLLKKVPGEPWWRPWGATSAGVQSAGAVEEGHPTRISEGVLHSLEAQAQTCCGAGAIPEKHTREVLPAAVGWGRPKTLE